MVCQEAYRPLHADHESTQRASEANAFVQCGATCTPMSSAMVGDVLLVIFTSCTTCTVRP